MRLRPFRQESRGAKDRRRFEGAIEEKVYRPERNRRTLCALGEKELAFVWLDKAYEDHDFILVLLKVEPTFDNLRSDPRFTALLKRIGLDS
jgi:hypothetical protein